ncbi:protein of unassigned function [Methylobacterium oryzae CBMB20]|uniref:Protein of unassigned function n=1 Tax=Methylobacterium oryzae CBMB20 TaxID=693986 RepID=A0A089P279_9HYPH|nr:protein of unassigned function [Methylobacterium oryzae CBMB20]
MVEARAPYLPACDRPRRRHGGIGHEPSRGIIRDGEPGLKCARDGRVTSIPRPASRNGIRPKRFAGFRPVPSVRAVPVFGPPRMGGLCRARCDDGRPSPRSSCHDGTRYKVKTKMSHDMICAGKVLILLLAGYKCKLLDL